MAHIQADADCGREPIHVPGGIQPHGYLFSFDDAGHIVQASANTREIYRHRLPLGAALSEIIGDTLARQVLEASGVASSEGVAAYLGTIDIPAAPCNANSGRFAIVMHRYGGVQIVELVPAMGNIDSFSSLYALVRSFVTDVQRASTVRELCEIAAMEIQRVAGFGRTLIYNFDDEGHGHVIAEAIEPGYASYLDQRFPASDIPAQARELYVKNRIRLIADANYVASPLEPTLHPLTGEPTDLTFASLRSVSPVHIEYMKNMGTLSSMSMSIVVGGKLWGLISCHHDAPRVPALEVRSACEHVAQVLSLQIEAKETHQGASHRLLLRERLSKLLARMAEPESFVNALVEGEADLVELTGSAGAVIAFEGRLSSIGAAPEIATAERLIQWLDSTSPDVCATDSAATVCPEVGLPPECAGFLALSVSKVFRNYIIWFRPEFVRTIRWAGDPRKKVAADDSMYLSPRRSFEAWTDTVRNRSKPWSAAEIEIATEFRTALLDIILRRAEEIAQLALELGRANKELEGFSYSVSHDLRAPLRHIVSFTTLLREIEHDRLSERGRQYVDRIATAARFGGRLVDDLLSFAQMGRAAIKAKPFDLRAVVDAIIANEVDSGEAGRIRWTIDALPRVNADMVFIHVAMKNLIENAVKYTRKRDEPTIEIGAYRGEGALHGQDVIFVRDNGAGFDMKYADKLFGVFQRLHRNDDYEGTGIGLANVRRIIERHGGTTWAEGAIERGATFYFSLPRQFRPEAGAKAETASAALARLAATGNLTPIIGERKEDTQ
ncbi:two-component system, chemotaxis family, sensor kinase Cph1 (plasmid) [Pararobbsia alpina]|uniref:ATP-binding protein n=1 Tax=Pararobbsia alpina TaxID=621374 RepID=UPI0039A55E45